MPSAPAGPREPPGTLYLVATPIGNLEDITFRAVRVLGEADLIAAEDTRHTRILLRRYAISTPLVSFHAHNARRRTPELVARLQEGARVALVSDAGTPGIADPGQELVRAAVKAGVAVVPVPGPSAVVAAVAASGFPTDRFSFHGFLPRRASARRVMLARLGREPGPLVFYEVPHRLVGCLEDLAALWPERQVVLARELTKAFETFVRGTPAQVLARLKEAAGTGQPRGELTLVVEGARAAPGEETSTLPEREQLISLLGVLLAEGLSRPAAARAVARAYGLSRQEAYRLAREAADGSGASGDR